MVEEVKKQPVKRSVLHGIHWERIILDEAHYIKVPIITY